MPGGTVPKLFGTKNKTSSLKIKTESPGSWPAYPTYPTTRSCFTPTTLPLPISPYSGTAWGSKWWTTIFTEKNST